MKPVDGKETVETVETIETIVEVGNKTEKRIEKVRVASAARPKTEFQLPLFIFIRCESCRTEYIV